MLEAIEKLLILQNRDKQIRRIRSELDHIAPERQALMSKTSGAQAALDKAKLRVKELESKRKALELEVQAKKELIEDAFGRQARWSH